VQPYPGPGPRVLISTGGGTAPTWRGDGREIYYTFGQDGATRLMAVPLTVSESALTPGTPRQLFQVKGLSNTGPARGYDVTSDGQRFLFVRIIDVPPSPQPPMVLVQNFGEELKRRVPVGTGK
jgi:hypothetical protein